MDSNTYVSYLKSGSGELWPIRDIEAIHKNHGFDGAGFDLDSYVDIPVSGGGVMLVCLGYGEQDDGPNVYAAMFTPTACSSITIAGSDGGYTFTRTETGIRIEATSIGYTRCVGFYILHGL